MLVHVNCKGTEKAIWDCNIRYWGPYHVIYDHKASVVCQGFSRLAGGDSECSGRLEVRQGQTWVSVCHGHEDLMAAQVVCRELGCGTALALYGAEPFGVPAGLFWNGAFECNGTEPSLSACTQQPPHIQNWTQPATIICSRKCWVCRATLAPNHVVAWGISHSTNSSTSLCCSLQRVPAGRWSLSVRWASGGGGTRGVGDPVCHCLGPA
eukprot:XP_025006881.1 scavenger receptor cysteine-rich type 1 protein M130-like [Gallus gallus]